MTKKISISPEAWRLPAKFADEVVACSYDWSPRLSEGETLTKAVISATGVDGLTINSHEVESNVSVLLLSAGGKHGAVDMLATLSDGEKIGVRLCLASIERASVG